MNNSKLDFNNCIEEALTYCRIGEKDLYSLSRLKDVTRCRAILYKVLQLSGKTTTWIGRYFKKDHSTITVNIHRLKTEDAEFAYNLYCKYRNTTIKQRAELYDIKELHNKGLNIEQMSKKLNISKEDTIMAFDLMRRKYKQKLIPDYKHYCLKTIYI